MIQEYKPRYHCVAMCKCGLQNYNFQDWIAHWKYGKSKWRAIKFFFLTSITFQKY